MKYVGTSHLSLFHFKHIFFGFRNGCTLWLAFDLDVSWVHWELSCTYLAISQKPSETWPHHLFPGEKIHHLEQAGAYTWLYMDMEWTNPIPCAYTCPSQRNPFEAKESTTESRNRCNLANACSLAPIWRQIYLSDMIRITILYSVHFSLHCATPS